MGEDFKLRIDATINRQFHDGVAEPHNPSEFLLKLLGRAENNLIDTKPNPALISKGVAQLQVSERRQMVQSIFINIEAAATEIAAAYRKACAQIGMNPGAIRVYVVGGRLQKDLQPRSDVDFYITLDDELQGFDLLVSDVHQESEEITEKKMRALKEFTSDLELITKKYYFFSSVSDKSVDRLDLHGWGRSEKDARQEWMQESRSSNTKRLAVLVHKG